MHVKIVTTAEGGLVTTSDPEIAHRLQLLRSTESLAMKLNLERPSEGAWYFEQQALGYNFRMTELQAAMGLSQLARLKEMHGRRSELAARYDSLLAELPLILPPRLTDRESAWHLYVIEIDGERTWQGPCGRVQRAATDRDWRERALHPNSTRSPSTLASALLAETFCRRALLQPCDHAAAFSPDDVCTTGRGSVSLHAVLSD